MLKRKTRRGHKSDCNCIDCVPFCQATWLDWEDQRVGLCTPPGPHQCTLKAPHQGSHLCRCGLLVTKHRLRQRKEEAS